MTQQPDGARPPEVAGEPDRDARRQEQLVDYAHRLGRDATLAGLDDDALEASVRTGASALAAATCAWLVHLAELVVRGVWAEHGAASPAAWLSWAVGQAPSTAREHVRVALRLRDCPLVHERFAAGTISYSKVRAITRVCDSDTEEMLLRWADAAPAAALERICADARRLQRAAQAPTDRDDLGLSRRWRDDGALEVVLVLDAVAGIAFEQRLDRLAELDTPAPDTPAPDTPAPDTPAPATPASGPVPDTPASDPAPDATPAGPASDTPASDRAADATPGAGQGRVPRRRRLADLVVGAVTAAVRAGPDDTGGDDRHLVVLHVPAEALVGGGDAPVLVRDGRGRTRLLPAGAMDEAACSATLGVVADPTPALHVSADAGPQAAAEDQATAGGGAPSDVTAEPPADPAAPDATYEAGAVDGEAGAVDGPDEDPPVQPPPPPALAHPADLGRRRREPSMRLRRALRLRDRTCRFPGCGASLFLHAHHVVYWSNGGRTDLSNLLLLCRYHHNDVVHGREWVLRPAGPGRWTFHRVTDAPPMRWAEPLVGASAGTAHPSGDSEGAGGPAGDSAGAGGPAGDSAGTDGPLGDSEGAETPPDDAAAGPATPSAPAPPASAVHAALAANRHLADPRALLPVDWDGQRHDHDLVMEVLARALDIAA